MRMPDQVDPLRRRWMFVKLARWIAGIACGSLVALGIAATPASGAADRIVRSALRAPVRSVGVFTPASADPRLAAIFARGGLDAVARLPVAGRRADSRAVTVRVAARSSRQALAAGPGRVAPVPAVGSTALQPIAYDLGVAVGWRRFTLAGDVARVDLAGLPGSRQTAAVGVTYSGRRFSGQVKAGADRPIGTAPRLAEDAPSYSIDVGGSYSLTRRLDVTAGVRYKAERDRLTSTPDTDDRRDSRAVYLGTAFRF